jgi:diguanylate cyclase (GGDEF)-like protein
VVVPIARALRDDRFYATRLKQLVRLDLDEAEAEVLWRQASEHRQVLQTRLGRDVGQHVALLDYIVNIRPRLEEPRIIERTDLEAIELQAVMDALTGLFNRRYFDAALRREVERCRRYLVRSSLLLLDLDDFKSINDRSGHLVGDAVLRRVGGLIQSYMRGADVACRIGGDEFAVILSDTPLDEAAVAAQRITAGIESAFRRERAPLRLSVTASTGVAVMTSQVAGPEAVLREADLALYATKRGRRAESRRR